jgi:hypothetical protein
MFFLFIVSIGHLSPINDHTFLLYQYQGLPLPWFIDPGMGRFIPLAAQEYNIVARLLWPSATLFYIVHAAKMVLSAALLLIGMKMAGARLWLIFSLWCAVFFSVGFGFSSVVMESTEINQLLLTLVLVTVMLMRERTSGNRWLTALACVGIIATFFYKETAFTIAIAFGCAEIARARSLKRAPRYALVLVLASLAYLAFFAAWHGVSLHGTYVENHAVSRLQTISNYADSDPFIVFVLVPVVAWRVFMVVARRSPMTIYDSFMIAALAYVAAFVMLGMQSQYYLVPIYGFAACGVAGSLALYRRVSIYAGVLCLIIAINGLPVVASDITGQRNFARNNAGFIDATAQWIWQNRDGKPRTIVFADTSYSNRAELFDSLKQFLHYAGVSDNDIDIQAENASASPELARKFGHPDAGGYRPRPGDVIVYQPFQDGGVLPPMLSPDMKLIHRSASDRTLPRWSIQKWIAECWPFTDCEFKVAGNSAYTGYSAFLLTRISDEIKNPEPIKAPAYEIGPVSIPDRLRAGTEMWVDVSIRNTGAQAWPVEPIDKAGQFVHMSYAWLDESGRSVMDGDRTGLPNEMRPGDTARVRILIKTPPIRGNYTLVLSPVQEGVAWFYQQDPNAPGAKKKIDLFQSILSRVYRRIAGVL